MTNLSPGSRHFVNRRRSLQNQAKAFYGFGLAASRRAETLPIPDALD
jgi:hypothetical protein